MGCAATVFASHPRASLSPGRSYATPLASARAGPAAGPAPGHAT
jgi:hypothetical protein